MALLGSSLSNNQLRLIQEITKKVIIFLDSDEIGRKKTLEIGLKFVQQGEIKCQVILFQDKDPAKELENFFGGYPKKEEQKRLFENKIIKLSFLDFIVHEAKNLSIKLQTKNDIETKKKILFFFAKYFSAIKNKVDKFYLISKAAELTKLPVSITAAVLRQKSHLNPFFFTTVDSLTATETDLDLDLRYLKIQKIILNKFYAQSRDKQNDVE